MTLFDPLPHNLRPGSIDVQFVDFDGVRFRLSTPQSKEIIVLSMHMRCWEQLAKYGVDDVIKREYGSRVMAQPEAEYHVSIEYALDSVPPAGGQWHILLLLQYGLICYQRSVTH